MINDLLEKSKNVDKEIRLAHEQIDHLLREITLKKSSIEILTEDYQEFIEAIDKLRKIV